MGQQMKHTALLLAAASFALASCQTMTDAAPAAAGADSYKAFGTEPFWSLVIDGKTMRFNQDEEVFASNVVARPSFNGWRYMSKNMTADVTFAECSDGMSEFTYKDTVSVIVGDKTYTGCGGGIVAPQSLEGTAWQFRSIGGAEILSQRETMLSFKDGRMSGSIGCNGLGADYRYENKALSVGPVMSTRMACADQVGAQESTLMGLLGAAFSTQFPGDGTMVLARKDGSTVVLMQSM